MGERPTTRTWRYVQRPLLGGAVGCWLAMAVLLFPHATSPLGAAVGFVLWLAQGWLLRTAARMVRADAVRRARWEVANGTVRERYELYRQLLRGQDDPELSLAEQLRRLRAQR